jgi:LysR family glycine cleavage system transcriptional activator
MRYPQLPSLSALRCFEAAARTANFTQAAAELHVTQSAVSHQVRALENQLGARLFRRERQALQLTRVGEAYLRSVREALDRLNAATEAVAGTKGDRAIIISVSPAFAIRWLIRRLTQFRRLHPAIRIHLNSARHHVNFEKDDVDLAIRHGSGIWPGLRADLLLEDELFPVCSPTLLAKGPPLRRFADLANYPLINDTEHSYWQEWFRLAGVGEADLSGAISFDDNGLIIEAAVDGQGIAIVRSILAADELNQGKLVRVFDLSLRQRLGYYIVCPEATADRPHIKAIRKWLLGEARGMARPRVATLARLRPR